MEGRAGQAGGFYGLLTRRVQRARLEAVRPFLGEGAGPFLDVGCGLSELPGALTAYTGCDRNAEVLRRNRARFPSVPFVAWDVAMADPPDELLRAGPFGTVLMLAILEHLPDRVAALRRGASLLGAGGHVIVTTPHPAARIPLEAGAALGLLSRHAAEEHETLLDRAGLERAAREAGLATLHYERFLFGGNQLALFGARTIAPCG